MTVKEEASQLHLKLEKLDLYEIKEFYTEEEKEVLESVDDFVYNLECVEVFRCRIEKLKNVNMECVDILNDIQNIIDIL